MAISPIPRLHRALPLGLKRAGARFTEVTGRWNRTVWFVGGDHRALGSRLVLDQLEPTCWRPVAEHALSFADHHRNEHQHQPVDQPRSKQFRIDCARPLDNQIGAVTCLECLDVSDSRQPIAVLPGKRLAAARQHVFAGSGERRTHRCSITLRIGPVCSENVIGPPPEQQVELTREQFPDGRENAVVIVSEQPAAFVKPPV